MLVFCSLPCDPGWLFVSMIPAGFSGSASRPSTAMASRSQSVRAFIPCFQNWAHWLAKSGHMTYFLSKTAQNLHEINKPTCFHWMFMFTNPLAMFEKDLFRKIGLYYPPFRREVFDANDSPVMSPYVSAFGLPRSDWLAQSADCTLPIISSFYPFFGSNNAKSTRNPNPLEVNPKVVYTGTTCEAINSRESGYLSRTFFVHAILATPRDVVVSTQACTGAPPLHCGGCFVASTARFLGNSPPLVAPIRAGV